MSTQGRPRPLASLLLKIRAEAAGTSEAEILKREEEGKCFECAETFSDQNVFTDAGWRETKLSGMCEKCWDNLFKDAED